MIKHLVIAGSFEQFSFWCRDAMRDGIIDAPKEATYCHRREHLLDHDYSKIKLHFVGLFHKNPLYRNENFLINDVQRRINAALSL